MAPLRQRLSCLLALVLLAGTISGCGTSDRGTISALAKLPLIGGVVQEMKQEDDEAEVREIREHEPVTRQERIEAHEAAEEASVQAAQANEEASEPEAF